MAELDAFGGQAQVMFQRLEVDSVMLVVAGPVPDTLRGTVDQHQQDRYSGDWSCGPDFPLSQDTRLIEAGLDSTLVSPGLLAVDSLRLAVSALQDSVLRLEAAKPAAYATGYNVAHASY